MMEEKERPLGVCYRKAFLLGVLSLPTAAWAVKFRVDSGLTVHCQTFSASCFEFVFPQKCSNFQTDACFRERKKKKEELSSHVNYFIFALMLAIMCAFC